MDYNEISRDAGSYIVILRSNENRPVLIGACGQLQLRPGYYLYAGSALGPGGLRARVGRHLAGTGRPRWHIDFLRQVTLPHGAWLHIGHDRQEHNWASALGNIADIEATTPGLGASDCSCTTHLFYTRSCPSFTAFNNSLHRLGYAATARLLQLQL
jgi:Uri superfamily endonuclease